MYPSKATIRTVSELIENLNTPTRIRMFLVVARRRLSHSKDMNFVFKICRHAERQHGIKMSGMVLAESCQDAKMFANSIPDSVYANAMSEYVAAYQTCHTFLAIRDKMQSSNDLKELIKKSRKGTRKF